MQRATVLDGSSRGITLPQYAGESIEVRDVQQFFAQLVLADRFDDLAQCRQILIGAVLWRCQQNEEQMCGATIQGVEGDSVFRSMDEGGFPRDFELELSVGENPGVNYTWSISSAATGAAVSAINTSAT